MTKKQVEIVNKTGLHARPASDFVLEAKKSERKPSLWIHLILHQHTRKVHT